jgi:hypothetical protein
MEPLLPAKGIYIDQATTPCGTTITDFWLMSRCRHFIIPNSTFAWWAAWLSATPQKQIIAPTHWFSDARFDDSDIVPSTWIRV